MVERDVDLRAAAAEAFRTRVKLARMGDVAAFCELIMKDEESGEPIVMAGMHEAWHELCDQHDRMLLISHVESGKTQSISIARTLWDLGRNPNLRTVILSNTKDQAKKIALTIKAYIETSEELRLVFPDMVPGKPWGEHAFSVARETVAKDASVQCSGVHGNILGARIDRLVMDDILDYENTRTAHARKDLENWVVSTVLGRLTKNARIRIIGNAWHPDDLLHKFAKKRRWKAVVYPVLDPETGESRWPEQWSRERIEAKREELGPLEFARQMLCQTRDDSVSVFKREWIDKCLALGNGRSMANALSVVPPGFKTFTGVDLAVQRHASADETALYTIAIDPRGNRHVLEVDAGKWSGQEIIGKINSAHHRYQSIVVVENNAAQDYLVQFARGGSAVPIRPFTTGRNKAHPEFGIQSIAAEMGGGKWVIPNHDGVMHPQVAKWVDEMLYYDPSSHTGDRLMACWFAREGHRLTDRKAESTNLDLLRR